jgi:hypothetical protein
LNFEKSFKKNKKKICGFKKVSYLCSPKQNGSFSSDVEKQIKKIETIEFLEAEAGR